MLEFDDIVTKEMYFDNQVIEDTGEESFNSLLIWILGALASGKSIGIIKKYISKQDVDINLKQNLLKTFKQQQSIILGKDKGFNLDQESLDGSTFTEIIKERKIAIKKRATRFMARSKELLKSRQNVKKFAKEEVQHYIKDVKKFVQEEVQRYIKDTESFWRTQTKGAREYAYETQDKVFDDIRGWMSVAILDNRTSAICIGLHNKFYSIKDYADRSEVPNKPPRHPNCRSILLTVREGINITEYKGQNIETFMKRNPEVAKDFMGKKKYKMWADGTAKIDKYIDLKGRRFYTNEEIIKRLGIKSSK